MEYEDFIIRILICFCLSFMIGIERQFRNRPVGLRTSLLVSIGAFLFVSYSSLVGASDISRIASQVVAGIGFLGAGVILKDGEKIRGLTTAATLWCVAAIGVLCAGGALKEATFGGLLVLFSNTLLRYINAHFYNYSNNKRVRCLYELNIYSKDDILEIKKALLNFVSKNRDTVEVTNIELVKNDKKNELIINFYVFKNKLNLIDNYLLKLMQNNENISYNIKKIKEILDIEADEM